MAEPTQEERIAWYEQLLRFRNDGASMTEADFQFHLNNEPGFREWYEKKQGEKGLSAPRT